MLALCSRIFSGDAGQWQQAIAPSQLGDHKGKQPKNSYNYSVPTQPFCFSFSLQYSINHMWYSTLYYKIGFVLDDFPQL